MSGSPRRSLLTVDRLEARHGLLQAVRGVSLSLAEGEKLALVGANGAGKTTLLRALAGAHPVAAGTVRFDGADVTALPAHRRVALGIALVPEGRRLFPEMTVVENLLVAARHRRPGPWNVDTVLDAFPLLRPLRHRRAATLSGGEQQATAIGRALMTNPRLLLLDEVSLGLAPVAVDTVYESLTRLIATGATVVLVEQDLERGMRIADRVICLLEGRIVLEGPAAELTRERVTAAYFGLGHTRTADPHHRPATNDIADRSDALEGDDRPRPHDATGDSDGDGAGQSDATGRGDPGSGPP